MMSALIKSKYSQLSGEELIRLLEIRDKELRPASPSDNGYS